MSTQAYKHGSLKLLSLVAAVYFGFAINFMEYYRFSIIGG